MPIWLKRALLGVIACVLIVVLAVAGAVAAVRADPARLEAPLEWILGSLLQRDLQIGRILDAQLSWDAYLEAEAVRLANPGWAEKLDMARVGRLSLRINLPSLWQDGPVIIHDGSQQTTQPFDRAWRTRSDEVTVRRSQEMPFLACAWECRFQAAPRPGRSRR